MDIKKSIKETVEQYVDNMQEEYLYHATPSCYLSSIKKFGLGGKYLGEGPLSYNHTRLREIELISIINVDNDIEVACNISKEFQKFNVYADYFDIIKWCNTHPHLVVSGHRSGTLKGIKFSQYFFGFTKDTISISKIQEVFKVNG